jgi:archaellum component FlaG (FlaF/FlaG flagellin family)
VDKAVVTILLMVAGVICSLVVFNTAYPAINRGASAISSISTKVDDRVKSQVEIIETAGESNKIYMWVKNIGASEISGIDQSDLFLGQSGATERISYNTGIPRWEYSLENNTEWVPTATIKITITLSSEPSGNYYVKFVIPNGISDVHQFSI